VRRFATVRHLADLYDRYAVHRPEMIELWAEGVEPNERDATSDASGQRSARRWQAELWRRLRLRIGVPSLAERLGTTETKLVEEPGLLDLPSRLSLFGLTRLPASHLRVLRAIAHSRDVHLFLLHPSGRLWDAVEEVADAVAGHPLRRRDDPTVALAANPLLRSWGRDARETQLVLQVRGITRSEHRPVSEPSSENWTLLQRLQSDIRADRDPPGAPRPSTGSDPRPQLAPGDDSLLVHSCHGRLRQVEVMRDAILHLLVADPTLEPRDVLVMCPDIESFAPLVYAVFGSSNDPMADGGRSGGPEPGAGPPQIRVRLADRSIRQTNPVLAVAARLLDLAGGRVAASEVLDLAAREPVARRFRFDEDELDQLERWVVETGIRWGLDREHRARWRLDNVADNTWQTGLDRLLVGVAMAEEEQRLYGGVLPLDDVPSGTVDLAGRFAEFVERLQGVVERLQGRHTIASWVATLIGSTESLALAGPHEQWQHEQLHWVLDNVVEEAAAAASASAPDTSNGAASAESSGALLDLSEVRSFLDGRLRGRPTRANFRTGDLTVCTLVPMRSVPHRVIGLLGLDDGAFPRHATEDGDDLLLAEPHVGDRDARSEDRQLLLDALLAATEHLIVTYEGRDPRMNQERAPCVPIAELLDVVDRTVRVPEGSSHSRARDHVVVEHPLQSFDPRNFVAGRLRGDNPWSFDPVDLAGALAHAAPPAEPRRFLSHPLERLDNQVIQLDSLVRFLEHPVRAFLRERLGWYGSGGGGEVKDALPVELDALEEWGVGDRLLDALLGGATLGRAREAEQARGILPPGALGSGQLNEIEQAVQALAVAARLETPAALAGPGSFEVNVRIRDGRALIGTVPDVYETGAGQAADGNAQMRVVRCLYSRLGPKHRLAAWARFLALTAARPDREVRAVTIGRGAGGMARNPRITISTLPTLGRTASERLEHALAELEVLVDLYDRGMCEPLPVYTKTSEKFVEALRNEHAARVECNTAWESTDFAFGEARDPEHVLVLGGVVTIDDLLTESARPDESGPGWSAERSRLGRLARRLWEPLLAHEHLEHPR
jgi:exodeoxyribonuclease V gamma subunit